jgi:hypothetical protein
MVPNRTCSNHSCLGRQRGATAFELTIVITLFLILGGVVFIGFTAWKHAGVPQNTTKIPGLPDLNTVYAAAWNEGANKAACLLNLSSIQKAMRGYSNIKNLDTGVPVTINDLVTEGFFTSVPECPAKGFYSFLGRVPANGIPFTTCSIPDHAPPQTANW